jgi:hypothetical protein
VSAGPDQFRDRVDRCLALFEQLERHRDARRRRDGRPSAPAFTVADRAAPAGVARRYSAPR